ncbi:ABC transporter ATP-binding protein/permease [Zavarzinia compransoris]|uniref:ABC transporter ATP-binding protein/permease n=1 Tax=Zavarzinia marina TaxID=2911065 RepID=UPI001F31F4A9|nr:ABC transporter ATP-binding protein/permease [Zavarzinia marina]MCF4165657.1 ABC transporter ATP-binding protein/permease [Zavarzinia marina]
MEPDFRRFLWRYSLRAQLSLLALALASFPFLWLYYEMPKEIVALIGGDMGLPRHLFGIELPSHVLGIEVTAGVLLGTQCFLLLALVVVNQRFRLAIERRRIDTAESALRRIRFQALALVLRFPQAAFRQRTAAETMASMGGEIEALSVHVGDAVAVPAYQGGTIVVIMTFLLLQDPLLAVAAAVLYPLAMIIVPGLQRRVNRLSRDRSRLMRGLGERVDETFRLITDIHANDQTRWTRAFLGARLGEVFRTRVALDRLRFTIATVNTLVQQAGPVAFYALGGWLVFQGRLDIGTLVAVIAAHKDMATPWRELLEWYQAREDAQVKYENTLRLYNRPDLRPPPSDTPPEAISLRGEAIVVEDVILRDESDSRLLDRLRLTIAPASSTALVGPAGGGREALAQALAGLIEPTGGRIAIGGRDVAAMAPSLRNRRIAYVGTGTGTGLQSRTIADNLAFGLQRVPRLEGTAETPEQRDARRCGNPADPLDADWIDYDAAGVADAAGLRQRMIDVMKRLGFGDTLFRLGLHSRLPDGVAAEIAPAVIAARALLERRLTEQGEADLVVHFDPALYNDHASLAENLLFGMPTDGTFNVDRMTDSGFMLSFLTDCSLIEPLRAAGERIAAVMIDIFAGVDPDHEMVRRFALVTPPELRRLRVLAGLGETAQTRDDRLMLVNLPFRVIAARHRLDAVDPGLKAAVVEARALLAARMPPKLAGTIARFRPDAVNPAASLLDNILDGRIAADRVGAATRVRRAAAAVLEEMGLGEAVMRAGLAYPVGIAGARLAPGERLRIAIGRALLRRPDVIVLDDVLGALDSACRMTVIAILRELAAEGVTVIASFGDMDHALGFDRVITIERGRIVRSADGDVK